MTAAIDWKLYQDEFRELLDTAEQEGIFADKSAVKSYFKELDEEGHVELDQDGRPVLELGGRRVGLSRANILAPGSDPRLAYKIMLARMQAILAAKSAANFELDWRLLMRLRAAYQTMPISSV